MKRADVKAFVDGQEVKVSTEYCAEKGCIRVLMPEAEVTEKIEVVWGTGLELNDNHEIERVYDLLNRAQGSNIAKELAYQLLTCGKDLSEAIGELGTTGIDEETRQALIEILTATL